MKLILKPFSGLAEHDVVFSLSTKESTLICDYFVTGNIEQINLNTAEGGARKMYLWLDTCFELFIKPAGGDRYYEFNFASNGDYNIFQFDMYRGPLQESGAFTACSHLVNIDREHLHFRAEIKPGDGMASGEFSFLPTMVMKLVTGEEIFYASHHSHPNPDFHDHNTYKNVYNFPE